MNKNKEPIPVIDIFAGPGGLGEGFSSVYDDKGKRVFRIALSIEKDEFAHQTLELRSFYRQFEKNKVPPEYYQHLRGEITRVQLFHGFGSQGNKARHEAWKAELGLTPAEEIDNRIKEGLNGAGSWVLIGGPPCQAYSIVGRARRQLKDNLDENDPRVFLYREYYRILAVHNPPIFVMENVKGLLSSKINDEHIFKQILTDLVDPATAYQELKGKNKNIRCPGYNIYSFVKGPDADLEGNLFFNPRDFIIRAEDYGIPQCRHRIVLLGIRKDVDHIPPNLLQKQKEHIAISKVLEGLPKLRSGISKAEDSILEWSKVIKKFPIEAYLNGANREVKEELRKVISNFKLPKMDRGGEYIECNVSSKYEDKWYIDDNLNGVCNHSTRAHIIPDIYRYLYASCFARIKNVSPKLDDFPKALLPDHENVHDNKFSDRFRVQVKSRPATTITSHISKDGHYYIHYDPEQCRSLTVREAARIQTFPDNYFFCGPRTAQYIQVGNAVPPFLSSKIAEIVIKQINNFLHEN